MPSAIPCSLSPLTCHIHSGFSRTGGVLSHLNSWHTGSLDFHRETCAPSSRLLCSLSSLLQRTQPTVMLLSLWYWQNRESILHSLRTPVPGHLSFHSALFSLGLFAPLTLWRLSVSVRALVLGPRELLGFWSSMVFRHVPIN